MVKDHRGARQQPVLARDGFEKGEQSAKAAQDAEQKMFGAHVRVTELLGDRHAVL